MRQKVTVTESRLLFFFSVVVFPGLPIPSRFFFRCRRNHPIQFQRQVEYEEMELFFFTPRTTGTAGEEADAACRPFDARKSTTAARTI